VFEPRLVALVASRVTVEDEDFKEYEIPVDELFREEGGMTHRAIDEVSKALMGRTILIHDPDGWTMYSVFSKCRYNRKKRTVTVRFDPDLKPHYLALKGHFTQYSLFEFLLLPSVYSQRIFEILKSWQPTHPEVTLPIEDLYKQLDVPESHRADFAAFRRRVLEKAHKDIHKHTSLRFDWEPVRQGRVVTGVRFVFSQARVTPVAAAKKKKAVADESQKRNQAMIAATKCFAEKQGQCTPRPILMCDICKKLVQKPY
jgi:plasmid replication initiation protein